MIIKDPETKKTWLIGDNDNNCRKVLEYYCQVTRGRARSFRSKTPELGYLTDEDKPCQGCPFFERRYVPDTFYGGGEYRYYCHATMYDKAPVQAVIYMGYEAFPSEPGDKYFIIKTDNCTQIPGYLDLLKQAGWKS